MHCPDYHHEQWRPLSCGHRSCLKCQNHQASQWIEMDFGLSPKNLGAQIGMTIKIGEENFYEISNF
ncbi:MAG: transposase zinc-binding domain-containing protein [Deltaproteobacteria bacterium]|nr:transposase zinc-binding domain-containing protein [Deltaproteobacteria bacterium]MBW1961004.1 transposase zinc-binding domain-containing protein [Deltaproteobacteria bacterium]MBW1992929.1 transposase zinc-binding domain-containing protein [Deltaproteobacteria bacterium]MBW2152771.1 transposase zinc-binding domain-containing protein [Deltaproteobacteria bacterium]